jgi:putative endonuclease
MFTVYILYSLTIDRFYIGQTKDFETRFKLHRDKFFPGGFTAQAVDWVVYFTLDCNSRKQALNVERHIKKMKSRKFIENLNKYPEIGNRLKAKYQ